MNELVRRLGGSGRPSVTLYLGDCLSLLRCMPAESVHCCVTSPPYWGLRDYGVDGQIGLEATPEEYTASLVEVFREVRRVLRDDGTLWLNLGDSYNAAGRIGHGTRIGVKQGTNRASANGSDHNRPSASDLKPKDLIGVPWRVAFALQAAGWYLRSDIIWHKPNPMPESVTDRPTKAHEYLFLLAKSEKYYYDAAAIAEPFATDPKENYPERARITGRGDQGAAADRGNDRSKSGGFPPRKGSGNVTRKVGDGTEGRLNNHLGRGVPYEYDGHSGRNRRTVWTVCTKAFPGAHFATYPPELIRPCVLAGCPEGGIVLDPFMGSGTTGEVASEEGRGFIGMELSGEYMDIAERRIRAALAQPTLFEKCV